MLRGYSWIIHSGITPGSAWGLYEILRIEPGLVLCKVYALTTVLLLHPNITSSSIVFLFDFRKESFWVFQGGSLQQFDLGIESLKTSELVRFTC